MRIKLLDIFKRPSVQNQEQKETEDYGHFNSNMLGTSGTRIFGEIYDEEYLTALNGTQRADEFDKMRRSDGQIQMLLTALKNPILCADWIVEPATSTDTQETELYKKIAEHVRYELFERPAKPFAQLLKEILSFEDFGFSVFEKVHELVRGDPTYGDYIGYKAVAWRSQRTIERFNLNRDGSILGITQQAYGDLDVDIEIPGQFLIVFSLGKIGDNYEGISRLRPIYGSYQRKKAYLKLMAIGIERYAIGTPIGTIPGGQENTPERRNFEAALKNFTSHQKSYMMLPQGWTVDFSKGTFDADKISQAIEMENLEMARSFVAQHLQLGTGGNGGAYALATDFSDQFLSIIVQDADIVCDGIQKNIIKEFVDVNYGQQKKYPTLKVLGINDKWGKEFAEIVKMLTETKHLTPTRSTEKLLRKVFELNELEPSEIEQTDDVRKTESAPAGFPVQMAEGSTKIQTLLFDKEKFTREQVASWIKTHPPFHMKKAIDETSTSFRVRQENPEAFDQTSFRTIDIKEGIKAVVGRPAKVALSEVQLAERKVVKSKVKSLMKEFNDKLYEEMLGGLRDAVLDFVDDIGYVLKRTPKNQWGSLPRKFSIGAMTEYGDALKVLISEYALKSANQAASEIPGPRLKFAELNDLIKTLPKSSQEKIRSQIALLLQTQAADIEKALMFALAGSVTSTNDVEIILKDLTDAGNKYVDGSSVVAAAGNTSSKVFNDVRMDIFGEPEVKEKINAYEFMNDDPQSPICQDLAGRVFAKDDPEAARFYPPLHHNCKSYLLPVFDENVEVSDIGLKPTRAELEKYITL